MKRSCGILLPISALPSPYGIGTLGKAAYDFVDFLAEAGQSWWQLLPVGPTSYGDSPYQSFSTYAGNPYFVDLELLCEDGLLERAELNRGTFYLHYLDLNDVLDDILTELMSQTTCAMDHVLCPNRQCATYPFCDKIRQNDRYQILFLDDSITEHLMRKLSDVGKGAYVTYLMSHSLLTFQEAEAIFTFQMHGCLAINRLMLRNHCTDWKAVQQTIDGLIRAGLTHYLLPDRMEALEGGMNE